MCGVVSRYEMLLVESHAMLGYPLMFQLHVEHGGLLDPCTQVA